MSWGVVPIKSAGEPLRLKQAHVYWWCEWDPIPIFQPASSHSSFFMRSRYKSRIGTFDISVQKQNRLLLLLFFFFCNSIGSDSLIYKRIFRLELSIGTLTWLRIHDTIIKCCPIFKYCLLCCNESESYKCCREYKNMETTCLIWKGFMPSALDYC